MNHANTSRAMRLRKYLSGDLKSQPGVPDPSGLGLLDSSLFPQEDCRLLLKGPLVLGSVGIDGGGQRSGTTQT